VDQLDRHAKPDAKYFLLFFTWSILGPFTLLSKVWVCKVARVTLRSDQQGDTIFDPDGR